MYCRNAALIYLKDEGLTQRRTE